MPASPTTTPLPLRPSPSPSPSPMAVVLDYHHQLLAGLKPWKRRCRLLSFPSHGKLSPATGDAAKSPAAVQNLSPSPSLLLHRSVSTPCFSSSSTPAMDNSNNDNRTARVEIIGSGGARGTQTLIVETAIALASGAIPIPASNGLGGAYFLRNRFGECFAVIKPIGDEPTTLSSILGQPTGSRFSVHGSETGVREVAAYLLDHGNFSGVSPTTLIKISHPVLNVGSPSSQVTPKKIASIQRFIPHDFDAGDLGPSRFSVSSVHRIAILDIRILNIDRHAGNILVRKSLSGADLVPIDHGLCLPELLENPYFEWLHWPQANVPFSEVESDYISALDPFKDAELLRSELPSLKESAIRILILCTIFLKRAAVEGLCLADIGGMMTREFCGLEEEPSMLEALCKQAEDSIRTCSTSFFLGDSSSEERDAIEEEEEVDDDDELIVQFEMDCDDAGFTQSCIEDVLDIPMFSQKAFRPLKEEEDNGDDVDEHKPGSLTKSLSLSAAGLNYESGGSSSGKCISFNRMGDEEWGLFLERFDQLLPEAFEARKSMGLKLRLGTSCKF